MYWVQKDSLGYPCLFEPVTLSLDRVVWEIQRLRRIIDVDSLVFFLLR
jgi:hypothetical protein